MKDYADRGYIHGRIHALMDAFPGRPEYAAMYNSTNVTSAFSGTAGITDEKNISRIKENLFREKIYTLLELIDASSYYRRFLVSILRLAEWQNILQLAARLDGTDVPDEWLDISPHHVLPGIINKKDITMEEIIPLIRGTYLEKIFQPGDESAAVFVPERFFMAFINSCAWSSRMLLAPDRKAIHSLLSLVMTLLRMSEKSRHKEYYSTEEEPREYEHVRGIRNDNGISSTEARTRISRSLKKYTSEMIYRDSPYLRILQQESMRMYRREWDTASTVIAYLVSLFILIRNLFMIAEGFRFGLAPQEMAAMVVCEG